MNPYQSPDVPSDAGSKDWLYILMFAIALVVWGPLMVALAIRGPTKHPFRDALFATIASIAWNFVWVFIILRIILWLVKS